MNFNPNPLFFQICKIYCDNYSADNKVIINNEGGSRSSKTYDIFHFIVWFCDQYRNTGQEIYILRDTMINCRDYTMKEFIKCMQIIGIDCSSMVMSPRPVFKLWGNYIYFRGLDSETNTEGYPSDLIFINEALETDKDKVQGLKMRCRKVILKDWNPKYTSHWCFDEEGQPNVFFTRTTYKNNKHLQKSIIQEIESYDPSNPENLKNGTADIFRWKVYGLGERCNREGLVHPNVIWIKSFPIDKVEKVGYGSDFGYTNSPSVITRVGNIGKRDLYIECLFYSPTPTINEYLPVVRQLLPKDQHITCDSADMNMIRDLRANNIRALAVSKVGGVEGFVKYCIDLTNRFNLFIVDHPKVKNEQENRVWDTVGGIALNKPKSGNDHFWDSLAYCILTDFRYLIEDEK